MSRNVSEDLRCFSERMRGWLEGRVGWGNKEGGVFHDLNAVLVRNWTRELGVGT